MPLIDEPALTCVQHAESTGTVELEVAYVATFSPIERYLVAHGLSFEEHITIVGEDPGAGGDLVLHVLPTKEILVSDGPDPVAIARRRKLTVPRGSLREDGWPFNDEIDARIDVVAVGMPLQVTSVTTREISLVATI
jgi:hypothetical protein